MRLIYVIAVALCFFDDTFSADNTPKECVPPNGEEVFVQIGGGGAWQPSSVKVRVGLGAVTRSIPVYTCVAPFALWVNRLTVSQSIPRNTPAADVVPMTPEAFSSELQRVNTQGGAIAVLHTVSRMLLAQICTDHNVPANNNPEYALQHCDPNYFAAKLYKMISCDASPIAIKHVSKREHLYSVDNAEGVSTTHFFVNDGINMSVGELIASATASLLNPQMCKSDPKSCIAHVYIQPDKKIAVTVPVRYLNFPLLTCIDGGDSHGIVLKHGLGYNVQPCNCVAERYRDDVCHCVGLKEEGGQIKLLDCIRLILSVDQFGSIKIVTFFPCESQIEERQ